MPNDKTPNFIGTEIMTDEEYLNKFYEPKFSPYDFMCLFAAINVLQKNYSFNRNNLIQFIANCKGNNQFCKLLNDIHIKSNGVFNFSEDLEEAMQKLKLLRVFYTISPETDSTMMIFENIQISELIKNRIEYFDEMVDFIANYAKYQIDIISQEHSYISEQEAIELAPALRLKKAKKNNC